MSAVTLVVCAAPLVRRLNDIVGYLRTEGWSVSVVGTPESAGWFNQDELTATLGQPARFGYRKAGESKSKFVPDVMAVCPATFNTMNKVAAGIADNYAVGLICETFGSGLPLLVAPMVNNKLGGHFTWSRTINSLRTNGAEFLDIQSGQQEVGVVQAGSGDLVVESFQPAWLAKALSRLVSTDG